MRRAEAYLIKQARAGKRVPAAPGRGNITGELPGSLYGTVRKGKISAEDEEALANAAEILEAKKRRRRRES